MFSFRFVVPNKRHSKPSTSGFICTNNHVKYISTYIPIMSENTEEQRQRAILQLLQHARQLNGQTGSNAAQSMEEEDISDIISQIMASDNSHFGPPPAARLAVEELDDFIFDEKDLKRNLECGICAERFEVNDHAKRLPCKHWFHADQCLLPWLQLHNTCPLCRHELPTLDYDYDAKRREKKEKEEEEERERQRKRDNYPELMYM